MKAEEDIDFDYDTSLDVFPAVFAASAAAGTSTPSRPTTPPLTSSVDDVEASEVASCRHADNMPDLVPSHHSQVKMTHHNHSPSIRF